MFNLTRRLLSIKAKNQTQKQKSIPGYFQINKVITRRSQRTNNSPEILINQSINQQNSKTLIQNNMIMRVTTKKIEERLPSSKFVRKQYRAKNIMTQSSLTYKQQINKTLKSQTSLQFKKSNNYRSLSQQKLLRKSHFNQKMPIMYLKPYLKHKRNVKTVQIEKPSTYIDIQKQLIPEKQLVIQYFTEYGDQFEQKQSKLIKRNKPVCFQVLKQKLRIRQRKMQLLTNKLGNQIKVPYLRQIHKNL